MRLPDVYACGGGRGDQVVGAAWVATQVKIEVNFVMRGTVRPVHRASLTPVAREVLMADLEIPVVSLEDMYAGKLVAA